MIGFSHRNLDNREFLLVFVGLALLLRLLLMPFFAHVDLFSEYRRIVFAIENGHLLDNSHRLAVYYIEMLFAWIATWFIPITDGLFALPDPTQSTAGTTDYGFFLTDPYVYRYLFFFKLPYLIFDLATAALIWRFVDDVRLRRLALLIWLFNPLTLFSTYIFGRFEVISLFFLCLTALNLKHHRYLLGALSFAVALWCREINLLFAPFFLLSVIDIKEHWFKNGIIIGLASLIIIAFVVLPAHIITAFGGNTQLFLDPETARSTDALNKLLSLGYHWFYPIIIGIMALLFYAWEMLDRPHAERFVISCALVLFVYFAFNVHSVHYAAWLMLFPILSIQYGARVIMPCIALWFAWLVLWLLKTDAGVFTLFLAAPLHTDFIGTGVFPNFFNAHIASGQFDLYQAIQMMRAVFASVLGYFAYRLIKRSRVSGE